VQERVEADSLHTDHVTIRAKLKYKIPGKVAMMKSHVVGGKTDPIDAVRVFV
jgi:hypothetical protein